MRSDLNHYLEWCRTHQAAPVHSSAEILSAYVATLVEGGLRPRSIQRRVWSIGALHTAHSQNDPAKSARWKYCWTEHERSMSARGSKPSRQAAPLLAEDLERMLSQCSESLLGLRDRTMLRFASETLCKSSQLVAIELEDVRRSGLGADGLVLVRATGEIRLISKDALACLDAWCSVAKITQGPIFRAIRPSDPARQHKAKGISALLVGQKMRKIAQAAGIENAQDVNSESLRVGQLSRLADDSKVEEILASAGWKTYGSLERISRRKLTTGPSGLLGVDTG